MNDHDVFAERLQQLSLNAPVPVTDPLDDLRRGRAALRRTHGRWSAGGAVTIVAAGAVVGLVSSIEGSPVAHDTNRQAAGHPPASATAAQARGIKQFCAENDPLRAVGPSRHTGSETISTSRGHRDALTAWRDPAVAPTLDAYRHAASDVLDPSGGHLDHTVSNIQSGCSLGRSQGLQSLGTTLGWRSGAGLGDVALEVSRQPEHDLQLVMAHDGWTAEHAKLPDGVVSARVVAYAGGHAVVAVRTDGLTVAVDATGVWGNNAAPGSPAADTLPSTHQLLTLAADSRLALP